MQSFYNFQYLISNLVHFPTFLFSSAYQYYSREHSSLVRDKLLSESKDAGMGDIVKIVSSNVSTHSFIWYFVDIFFYNDIIIIIIIMFQLLTLSYTI